MISVVQILICAFLLYNSFIAFEACFARVLTEEDVESSTTRRRTTRSMSMNHQSSPTAVTASGGLFNMITNTGNIAASATSWHRSPSLPPPRRKRPESVQLTLKRVFDLVFKNDEDARSPFANAFTTVCVCVREREETGKSALLFHLSNDPCQSCNLALSPS